MSNLSGSVHVGLTDPRPSHFQHMPFFVSRRELARIEREASDCRKRESEAKARLKEERERVDRLSLAVLDLASKKLGAYPISTQVVEREPEPPESPEGYMLRLKQANPAMWEYYRQIATDAGRQESEAEQWLINEVMGLPQPYEREM